MGHCLAEIHRALADLPDGVLTPRMPVIDRAATLSEIDRLSECSRRGHHTHDPVVLHCLASQRAYIESLPANTVIDLALLPLQPIHGDYTETNLFFEHGTVSAIIDRDQAYLAPRAWEVIRVMHLVFEFNAGLAGPFHAAYRTVLPLTMEEKNWIGRLPPTTACERMICGSTSGSMISAMTGRAAFSRCPATRRLRRDGRYSAPQMGRRSDTWSPRANRNSECAPMLLPVWPVWLVRQCATLARNAASCYNGASPLRRLICFT